MIVLLLGCTQSLQFEIAGNTAIMTGDLTSSSPDVVARLLEDNPQLEWIELLDCPGSTDDASAYVAARMIRNAGINTRVPADGDIASGAVDFFIAGVQRDVLAGGKVGVHSWSDGAIEGSEVSAGDPEHDLYLEFYAEMGIASDFYWFTLNAAPSDGLHYMTRDELQQYGLISFDLFGLTKPRFTNEAVSKF